MTSGAQPPFSGAPIPVQGVTGGPPVLGGQIGNDPSTGNVVVAPNPGQVLQVRKGSNPTSLQVYEYFHTNTDFSRIALNSQTGGPFQLAVETAPSTVIRALDIRANGGVTVNGGPFVHQAGMFSASPAFSTALTSVVQTPITLSVNTVGHNLLYVYLNPVAFTHTAANAVVYLWFFLDSTNLGIYGIAVGGVAGIQFPAVAIANINLGAIAPGAHTVTLAVQNTTAGTLTLSNAIGSQMTVTEYVV